MNFPNKSVLEIENKEDRVMENKDAKKKMGEVNDQELQDVVGGGYQGSYADDPQA